MLRLSEVFMRSYLAFGFTVLFGQAVFSQVLSIRADEWCPYNCDPSGKEKGYVIEILESMASKHQLKLDYQIMPWSRSLNEARSGKVDMVIGAVDGDREGLIFSEPIGRDSECVFAIKGSPIKSIEDLNQFSSIGTVIDYVYSEEVMTWITANPQKIQPVGGDNPLESNFKKVLGGRISALLENQAVGNHYLNLNPDFNKIKSIGCLAGSLMYVAFSKSKPDSQKYVNLLNKTLIEMKKTGEFKKLLQKYNVPTF